MGQPIGSEEEEEEEEEDEAILNFLEQVTPWGMEAHPRVAPLGRGI